jgi:hypothetical protein
MLAVVQNPARYRLGRLGAGAPVTSAAGNVLLQAAPLAGPAAPFVAVAGAVTELLGALGVGGGCGQTCITATTYANQAEVLLKQNLAVYQSLPTPRTLSQQAAGLAQFDQIWNGLEYACAGVPGAAGTNCIADRQRGGKFPWFTWYRDPIANDPGVVPDAVANITNSPVPSLVSAGSSPAAGNSGGAILLGLGLVILGVLFR